MSYTKMGLYTVVPAADLIDKDAAINVKGPGRVALTASADKEGVGKHAGALVIRDAGTAVAPASQYSLVMALGNAATDEWIVVDGSATYTPV